MSEAEGEGHLTEAEFLAATDGQALANFLYRKPVGRKLLLWACACCQRIERLFTDPCSRRALEAAGGCAEGGAGDAERAALNAAWQVLETADGEPSMDTHPWPYEAVATYRATEAVAYLAWGDAKLVSHLAARASVG